MPESILWSLESLTERLQHADSDVRRWALENIERLYPLAAPDIALRVVDDPADSVAHHAIRMLMSTPDADRFKPLLLERLATTQGERFGFLALELGEACYREALPVFRQYIQDLISQARKAKFEEMYGVISGAGYLRDPEARDLLWLLSQHISPTDDMQITVLKMIALSADASDLTALLSESHQWPTEWVERGEIPDYTLAIGARRALESVRYPLQQHDFHRAVESAGWGMGVAPQFSAELTAALAEAFSADAPEVFSLMRGEAYRLCAARGDDLETWRAEWEQTLRVSGYRRVALVTTHLLDLLAESPSPHPAQQQNEAIAMFTLLCELSVARDDEAWLAQAEDPTAALLSMLADDRLNVLPDVVERVVALGPAIVPRLIPLLDPASLGWGIIRVEQAIEELARRYPGSADAAIPALIAMLTEDQDEMVGSGVTCALTAIGPASVEKITEAIAGTTDTMRHNFLSEVLGHLPTERSVQVLLTELEHTDYADELLLSNIEETGSAAFIAPLKTLWQQHHDRDVARTLLLLSRINGIEDPELPEWEKSINSFKSLWEQARGDVLRELEEEGEEDFEGEATRITDGAYFPSQTPSFAGTIPKKKGISSKEKKRRSADKKQNRKKR